MSDRFEPALYSLEANKFITEHAGEAPELAFISGIPNGMAQADIYPIIDKVYRLKQQEQHVAGFRWCGVDAIKSAAERFLKEYGKWSEARKRGGPAYPTLFAWDGMGRGHLHGVGSDSGFARTYFDEQGNRHQLGVDLIPLGDEAYIPEWVKPTVVSAPVNTDLEDDEENGLIRCPICQFTQTYEQGSQARRNMARARVGRHLRTAKKHVEEHRQLYSFVFGGSDTTR